MAAHTSKHGDTSNLRPRRGKQPHHGGDVCGIVVLGSNSTFCTIPIMGIPRGGSFLAAKLAQSTLKRVVHVCPVRG